VAADIITRKF